jgi:acetyl-CoA acyltransferase
MKETYIVDSIRTPVGKYGGTLAAVRPDDLAALVIKELMKRNPSIDWNETEDVIFGNANGAGEENRNVARMSLLLAGLPYTVPGESINRLCSSGMSAAINASRAIKAGDGEIFIAGGVESMSRAPFVLAKSDKAFSRNAEIYDTSIGWRFVNPKLNEMYGTDSMGETAENVAEMYSISREDQDMFAYKSQMKAAEARDNGRLSKEILPVEIPQRRSESIVFKDDEFIRDTTTLEKLAKLKPAFKKGGTVTAGNASGVNDGAAALLVMSEDAVKKYNLKPLVRIVSNAVVGVEPRIMGIGPVEASNKALRKAGMKMDDIDVIELNEAFSAQSLACIREWGLDDYDPRINPNGGAIAIGHPLGMTGARLLTTAAYELIEQNKKYALTTLCVGVGQGYAAIIENVR